MSNVTRLPRCPKSRLNAHPTTGNAKRQLHRWLKKYGIHAAREPL